HHWFDATHITYGVVTAGVYGKRWKAETSVFNGREPDETRTDFDFGPLDSWSGRVWFLPTSRWALQLSAGKLTEAEASDHGGPRTNVDRVTASATYHRLSGSRIWASTVGWGRNAEPGQEATNALLAETSLLPDERNTWLGRFELSQKSGHDLAIDAAGLFTVAKLEGAYTRFVAAWNGLKIGVGGDVSASIVPESLAATYGSRVSGGFGVFVTIRPGSHAM